MTAVKLFMVAVIMFFVGTHTWAQKASPLDPEETARGSWFRDRTSEMVFFAVLEGLYTDGVSNDVVDLIIPPNPKAGQPDFNEHFVYTCPLCHPAYEAFEIYRERQPFFGQKITRVDSFGAGLDPGVIELLRSNQKQTRLDAIQSLIQRWVRRRLDLMRLTPEEMSQWELAIKNRREQGMKALQGLQSQGQTVNLSAKYAGWKKCAICEGSVGACQLASPAK